MKNKLNSLLKSKIKEYENIIIAKHINPDWDAQGSAIGIANIINDNFKNKNIFVVGERMNDEITFSSEKLNEDIIRNSLLITVDTANIDRVDFDDKTKVKETFKIDHHLNVDEYGDYNMVYDKAIACTQIIALWARDMKLKVSKEAAKNLYKGLVTDSGRFLFQNVDDKTFDAASFLMKSGINLTEIQEELYLNNLNVRQWQNKAFSKMKITKNNVAYIVAEPKDYDKYKLTDDEIKSCLFTMSGIKEIPIWCTIIILDDQIKVSLRSRKHNVNLVARNFNGGGHNLASGAKLDNLNQLDDLLYELDQLVVQKNKI